MIDRGWTNNAQLKFFLLWTLFIVVLSVVICRAQTKMGLDLSFEGQMWYSYVIDSTWLGINEPDGDLPRRGNGTYGYWLADGNGDLIPVRKFRKPVTEPYQKYTVME